jgi:hypothetical protein
MNSKKTFAASDNHLILFYESVVQRHGCLANTGIVLGINSKWL